MLVTSMTLNEIRREIEKDYPVIFRKASYVAHKIYRLFAPAKNKTVSRMFDYYSHNKNTWLYKVIIENKKEYLQLMVYYYNDRGLCVYQKDEASDYLVHYTAHFFHRYNERRNLQLTKPVDIIKAFMNDNSQFLFSKRKQLRQGVDKVFCLSETGIMLGTKDAHAKTYHVNTYIPYTMLYKRQLTIIGQIYQHAQQTIQEAIKKQLPPDYLKAA